MDKTKLHMCIDDLKDIRLRLFRSVANLDKVIEDIEYSMASSDSNDEYIAMLIKHELAYRDNYKESNHILDIDKVETVIWKNIISSIIEES